MRKRIGIGITKEIDIGTSRMMQTMERYRTGSAVTWPTIDPAVPLGSPPLTERSSSSYKAKEKQEQRKKNKSDP